VSEGQPPRRTLEAGQLDVFVNANAEQRRKLPVEMVFGRRRDLTQHVHAQIIPEMFLDVAERLPQTGVIALEGGFLHNDLRPAPPPYYSTCPDAA
jgi:hypothetical protein